MKLVFAGTPDFAATVLQGLLRSRHQVAAVLTQPDRPAGRGRRPRPSPVKALAMEHACELQQPGSLRDASALDALAAVGAQCMVVAAYGLLLPQTVLDLFPPGCINVHASLLPRWRGAAPIQRAILAGDTRTGVSIMRMARGLDTGDVFLRVGCEIRDSDTGGSLHDRLAIVGRDALLSALEGIEDGSLVAQPQGDTGACYAEKLSKDEASMDWTCDAAVLARNVRAYHPWPVAFTHLGTPSQSSRIRIHAAVALATVSQAQPGTVVAVSDDFIDVACGSGCLRLTPAPAPREVGGASGSVPARHDGEGGGSTAMTGPDARLAALGALTRTAFEGVRLEDALSAALEGLPAAREQALARAIAYGTCRQWHRLGRIRDQLLRRALKPRDRELAVILLMGLHQLLDLRIPAHAAVNESVALARRAGYPWAAKMVNAVLRRATREGATLEHSLRGDPAARLSHPQWLLDALRTCWPERWQQIAEANNQHPPMTLRVNTLRCCVPAYLERLQAIGLDATSHPYLPEAVTLVRAVDVKALPGFDDGLVSVQDGAAQLAASLLPVAPDHRVLDACAAPGGKSAHLLERHPTLAGLVAVDSVAPRVERLVDGLARLGLSDRARCLVRDARALRDDFPDGHFQAILLDAPCTATGVIRRHPDIKLHRNDGALRTAGARQRELLESLWPLLARHGTLLYATCSVLSAENEDQIDAFLAGSHDAKPAAISLPFGSPRGAGHQILPGDSGMDGFFYALLVKS